MFWSIFQESVLPPHTGVSEFGGNTYRCNSIVLVYLYRVMMSNKCYYAVRAMVELTKHEGAGPLTIGAIAAAQGIPVRFLEAILRQLKQAGLTDSHRGKDGGYVLARSSREIAVGEVIQLFESARAQTGAANNSSDDSSDAWVIAQLHQKAEAALAEVYGATTFADLARRIRDREANFVVDYSI